MLANSRVAFVFPVSIPVRRTVTENFICRAKIAVKEFVIDIFVLEKKAIFRLGAGVGAQEVNAVVFHLLCYGRRLVCGVSNHNLYIQVLDLLVYAGEGFAVVFIAGVDAVAEDDAIDVAGSFYAVCKYVLVLSLAEPAAFRIAGALLDVFFFLLSDFFFLEVFGFGFPLPLSFGGFGSSSSYCGFSGSSFNGFFP